MLISVRPHLAAMLLVASFALPLEANASSSSSQGDTTLDEVVVTAQKTVQFAQDVPMALSVLDARSLIDRNEVSLDDYYTQVPGLTLFDDGNGFKLLAIRGITTGANNTPTVGVYVDDTPVGSSTALARGDVLVPDLDPADLQQVEVLKGPQGTLSSRVSRITRAMPKPTARVWTTAGWVTACERTSICPWSAMCSPCA
jgi:outer membrane receptor protein involved in Fe transport